MKAIIVGLILFCGQALASPFLTTDPSTDVPTPTGCTCAIDGIAKAGAIVLKACKVDLTTMSIGSHTATCQFSSTDPIWGNGLSVPSAPFTFARPGVPSVPANLSLSVN